MPRLIVLSGVDEGKQFEVTAPVVSVGRHSSCDVVLHDTQVSRRHLELRANEAGDYELVDLDSGNGSRVNGQWVRRVRLRPGDRITLGQTQLLFTAARADGSDQTERVKLLPASEDLASAIVRSVPVEAGSQILARPEQASTDWLRHRLAHLATLYETADAVSNILDTDALLEKVMDLVFRSIDADHGCFMLRGDEGRLEARAVRRREGLAPAEAISVSRTIVEYVLRENRGILVSDAQADTRFAGGDSIHRHKIREAICVPMRGRHDVVGVLFLDTHSSLKDFVAGGEAKGKFSEDHLNLAVAVAHQAAIAVEESRYHQALLHAERLAAIGQTIAGMSHHIKNIMQGVRFGSDMVRTALADNDMELLKKGWRLVERNQARIDQLILDMLSFSKEREPALEPTDLNKLCEEVLDVVRGRAQEQQVTLDWRPGRGVEAIPCDPEGIHRALLNIVSNAVDAVEGRLGAKVSVQTLREPDAAGARIIVVDNGPGIPAEQLEDIFKPFVSTKGARGTGLGLPVSRKILREHGGDILVQSVPGKGTKFVLRLPLRSDYSGENPAATVTLPIPSKEED